MKAVLLCAGQGTRLHPLTFNRPKHLLPVAGRAVLDHVLESLAGAGVEEAVFVVAPGESDIRSFVGGGERWGMSASFCEQDAPLGLAHALSCARGFIGPQERFLMYLGDDLLGDGVAEFTGEFMASGADASLIVQPVADPRAFGVVVQKAGVVTRLVEKPEVPPSSLAIVGVYGFGPRIWEAIDNITPSARGELEITDAIEHLVETGGRVECHVSDGFWADAGSPEALLRANRFFLERMDARSHGDVDGASTVEGHVQIGAGARIVRSNIVGPCLVGEDCVIEDSSVGPGTALGIGCNLRHASVSDSIIDDHTQIEHAQGLTMSIVGRDAILCSVGGQRALSLLLADRSRIMPPVGG